MGYDHAKLDEYDASTDITVLTHAKNSKKTPQKVTLPTSTEIGLLDGASAGSTVASKAVVANATGLIFFKGAQTLDMADAQVALTLATITSNVLYVDPNSSGGTEDLLLPPEAACDGLVLFIANTAGGAEDIVVKEDGDSVTICTISQSQIGVVFCDGTTWRGGIMPIT